MTISSRTPEGTPNQCPACGDKVKIVPSTPTGDAPCPSCGSLLWFIVREPDVLFFETPLTADQGMAPDSSSSVGDRVRIKGGVFEDFEGDVSAVDTENGRVTMIVIIFGRPTPIELEYWQVESV